MLSPDYLDACGDFAAALYEPLQTSIIEDMARRIVRMSGVGESTVFQLERLQESGMLFGDVMTRLAESRAYTEQEIATLFEQAGAETLAYDDDVYRKAGLNPAPIAQSPAMLDTLIAGLTKTHGALFNLTVTTATATQTQFIAAMDLAYLQVSSGAMSHTQAVRGALHNMARAGVTSVRYDKKGRASSHKMDVAARRAVITGVNQTAAELQLMRLDEMGWELVEVTAHFGARPAHAEWQGQIYSRYGNHSEYPDFESETGYGTGEGLCGWNCRHNFFPYLNGHSRPAYSADELKSMEEKTVKYGDSEMSLYDATQTQRGMERRIRELKRELAATNAGITAAKDDELRKSLHDDFTISAIQLKAKERELKDFSEATGLNRQREREQVVGVIQDRKPGQPPGFGRSVAAKAVWWDKAARGIAQRIH